MLGNKADGTEALHGRGEEIGRLHLAGEQIEFDFVQKRKEICYHCY